MMGIDEYMRVHMKARASVEAMWDTLDDTGLMTGAWGGMLWRDLPEEVQDEFVAFVLKVRDERRGA